MLRRNLRYCSRHVLVFCVLLFGAHTRAFAQAETDTGERAELPKVPKYYYYDPDGLGAHAFYNPQNFIVQGGLGALYDERVDRFDWGHGFSNVNRSLARPIAAVRDYGAGRFFYREFVPHLGPGQNYVPNYVWHLVGGGMRTKLMEEYYTHLGLRQWHARLAAWATMYTMHYVNEAVQAERFKGNARQTTDAIADMYFFDWVGGLFFQFDVINRFMSGTLHQREWSFQAQYDIRNRQLFNNGQLYWMRLALTSSFSLSFLTGEQITSLNITYGWGAQRQLSFGMGPKSKSFIARKNGDTDPTAIVFSAGLYYSINDNPFVTFTFEPEERAAGAHSPGQRLDGKYMLNLYPGVVRFRDYPIALSFAYQRETFFAGFGVGALPMGIVAATR